MVNILQPGAGADIMASLQPKKNNIAPVQKPQAPAAAAKKRNLGLFNEQLYLQTNPDVAMAVAAGQFASGKEHYDAFGQDENRAGAGTSPLLPNQFILPGQTAKDQVKTIINEIKAAPQEQDKPVQEAKARERKRRLIAAAANKTTVTGGQGLVGAGSTGAKTLYGE